MFWLLEQGDCHLRPWEIRRLRFPSELERLLDSQRYDPKKPPAGAQAHGHAEVLAHLARRRQMTAEQLVEEAKRC